jgi:tRNA-binding protein
MTVISFEEFNRVDIRSGRIIKVEEFPRARKSAFKIWADFGPEIGVLQTSAQVTIHYTLESLINRPIVGCVNLGEKEYSWLSIPILIIRLL